MWQIFFDLHLLYMFFIYLSLPLAKCHGWKKRSSYKAFVALGDYLSTEKTVLWFLSDWCCFSETTEVVFRVLVGINQG